MKEPIQNKDSWVEKNSTQVLQDYLKHQHLYTAAIKEVTTKLEILDEEFQVSHEHNPIHHIETRLKTPPSIRQKLEKHGVEFSQPAIEKYVQDVAGVRVICNYIEDIYTVSDLLTKQSDISLVKKDDYIQKPKESGYRSLHLVVTVPIFLSTGVKQIPVEVQIRTIAMDFWASLEHQLRYKSGITSSQKIHHRLKCCAESIAEIDTEMQDIFKTIRSSLEELE